MITKAATELQRADMVCLEDRISLQIRYQAYINDVSDLELICCR